MSYLLQSPAFLFSQYMIVSTNITNTDIFKFIAVLVFKLFSHQVFFIKTKDNSSREKIRYFLKKTANLKGKLLQNYKQLECKIFEVF